VGVGALLCSEGVCEGLAGGDYGAHNPCSRPEGGQVLSSRMLWAVVGLPP
jgi:hypothetical protein